MRLLWDELARDGVSPDDPQPVARELAPARLCRSWRSLRSFDLSLQTQLAVKRSQPRFARQLLQIQREQAPAPQVPGGWEIAFASKLAPTWAMG
ncbi:hypothetical protein CEQ51_19145 [Pseudomonas thivervalensis]|uniref:Uncharacterized protein n=1 Tax=Pseudomonas thivervalensis TaxID=86265 RepID=A0A2Z4ZUE3_9PSED|nr:hypothetical protein CE140_18590 [Pseudomonas thivervalensis]AXA62108.1 hypothetical protein CEQ51_19145 [Pseudomonas thivervalensis]